MPCYFYMNQAPSRDDYTLWLSTGFRGTYEEYETAKRREYGGRITLCGDFGPHCADCSGVGDYLCDYPVGDDKTCDRPMCDRHVRVIGPNTHYCITHNGMWNEYKQRPSAPESKAQE